MNLLLRVIKIEFFGFFITASYKRNPFLELAFHTKKDALKAQNQAFFGAIFFNFNYFCKPKR